MIKLLLKGDYKSFWEEFIMLFSLKAPLSSTNAEKNPEQAKTVSSEENIVPSTGYPLQISNPQKGFEIITVDRILPKGPRASASVSTASKRGSARVKQKDPTIPANTLLVIGIVEEEGFDYVLFMEEPPEKNTSALSHSCVFLKDISTAVLVGNDYAQATFVIRNITDRDELKKLLNLSRQIIALQEDIIQIHLRNFDNWKERVLNAIREANEEAETGARLTPREIFTPAEPIPLASDMKDRWFSERQVKKELDTILPKQNIATISQQSLRVYLRKLFPGTDTENKKVLRNGIGVVGWHYNEKALNILVKALGKDRQLPPPGWIVRKDIIKTTKRAWTWVDRHLLPHQDKARLFVDRRGFHAKHYPPEVWRKLKKASEEDKS